MFWSKRILSPLLLVVFVVLTLAAAPSLAVVTYGLRTDPADPYTAGMDTSPFTDPGSAYYGMNWSYNYQTGNDEDGATLVAVNYFTLLTARHYTLTLGSTFTVPGGDTFSITSIKTLTENDPGQTLPQDLRVVHVKNETNPYRPLPGFYDLYTYDTTSPWPPEDKSFVIVGTGDTGLTTSKFYYTDTENTRALRWGTNKFDSLVRKEGVNWKGVPSWSTQCIKMSYNRNSGTTPYECGVGVHDSGGGVFVKDGDTWKLAGINLYMEAYSGGYSTFHAASIPYYAPQLSGILQSLHDMLPGDMNSDGRVDANDYITLKEKYGTTVTAWTQGDFNGDGLIGYPEYLALVANLGYDHSLAMSPDVSWSTSTNTGVIMAPEPASALLLAFGAAALLKRRRKS